MCSNAMDSNCTLWASCQLYSEREYSTGLSPPSVCPALCLPRRVKVRHHSSFVICPRPDVFEKSSASVRAYSLHLRVDTRAAIAFAAVTHSSGAGSSSRPSG